MALCCYAILNLMKHERGAVPIVIALLIAFGVLGVGGFAYQKNVGGVAEKLQGIFAPEPPDELLAKAFENFSKTTAFRFSGESSGRVGDTGGPSGLKTPRAVASTSAEVTFDGAVDLGTSVFTGTFAFDVRGAKPFRLAVEARKIASTTYLLISEAPKEFAYFSGQWVSIDLESTAKKYGQERAAERVSAADMKRVREFFAKAREYKVFKTVEEFPEEEVGGVVTRHIRFTFDKPALEKLIREFSAEPFDADEEAALRHSLARIDFSVNDVWVGKRDRMPYRFTVRYMEKWAAPDSPPTEPFSFDVFFSDFNRPVEVEVPPSAKTLEEVLQAAMTKMFPGATVNVKKKS